MAPVANLHGILLIDKAQGWTSHDVVAKARRITGQRKIGHTGTLDPMATGLLVLCLGDGTRLVEYMTGHDKRYQGEIVLGVRTATDDAEGEVLETRPLPRLSPDILRSLERRFTGPLEQRPPAYSAVKVEGQRAYAAARAGKALDLPPRRVMVHELGLRQSGPGRIGIDVHCGAGTYIRSLARDIGEVLGCGAHLAGLRRTTAGGFSVADACTLDQLGRIVEAGLLSELLRQPDEGVTELDAAIVTGAHGKLLEQGIALDGLPGDGTANSVVRVYVESGSFLGIAELGSGGRIRPLKVLASARSL